MPEIYRNVRSLSPNGQFRAVPHAVRSARTQLYVVKRGRYTREESTLYPPIKHVTECAKYRPHDRNGFYNPLSLDGRRSVREPHRRLVLVTYRVCSGLTATGRVNGLRERNVYLRF